MAANAQELVSQQEQTFDKIKNICVNYKKDSAARKTLDYLEKRMVALNAHWQEFQSNHTLLNNLEDKEIVYFQDDIFSKTKTLYEEIMNDMMNRKTEITSKKGEQTQTKPKGDSFNFEEIKSVMQQALMTPRPDLPTASNINHDRKNERLRQQICNFKAFERVANKINLNEVKEKWEMEDYLNILKAKWDIIDRAHWELDYILQGSDTAYDQEYAKTERSYDNLKKQINQKMWDSVHYEKATPKIQIPDFYGNCNQWLSFKDLFTESVHSNPVISKAQKMQHLKSKLKGEAEKLIQHLTISADNYDSCWEIINHRYDNRRLIFSSYMNTFLNQPIMQQATAHAMRKLHDVTLECLNGLGNIGLDTTSWDPIIVHLLSQKLDSVTYGEYIKELKSPRGLPDLEEFINFLESKFIAFETLQQSQNQKPTQNSKQPNNKRWHTTQPQQNKYNYNSQRSSHANKADMMAKTYFTTTKNCPICKTDHVLMQCDKFLSMSSDARNDTVSNLQLCNNCLYSHGDKQCRSRKRCKLCYKAHHTLLHDTTLVSNSGRRPIVEANQSSSSSKQRIVNNILNGDKEILLTTVQVLVQSDNGNYINLRALLDQGSQVNLITEDAAQRLRLPRQHRSAVISGIGSLSGNCKGSMHLHCKSIHSHYTFNVEALIMRKLINNLPSTSFSRHNWEYLDNLKLADPEFNISGPIDILLGAEIYAELILDGVIKNHNHLPVAQQTRVGWILCGNVKTLNCLVTLNDLEDITRFWESEEIISDAIDDTTEQAYCEKYYTETTERQTDGKYIVKMPMKLDYKDNLGNTRSQAVSQFLQLERKMEKNKEFANEYKHFMKEYQTMGHMIPISKSTHGEQRVYLPHHGVLKTESSTTRLRAVFNASLKSSTNHSLNDLMHSGPNLQKDMLTILINWRTHKYVFTADVEKMYRQIMLHGDQQHLQTIIWRESSQQPLQEWQLGTVTYGTKAAPYLAMRTLQQLAQDEGHMYPEAAEVLQKYFYVDDLLHGKEDIDLAKALIQDLIKLLRKGGFNLRKWTSNEPSILEDLADDQKCQKNVINFTHEQSTKNTKTLGICWNPMEDKFIFAWNLPVTDKLTKRTLLSDISKLYDPLGWLSPAIIKAKLLFQNVWVSKIEWDDNLPSEIATEWKSLRKDLPNINRVSLPRWLQCTGNELEIHGFCDASIKAYACVIYSRTATINGDYVTTLITAKTKVAPLNKKVTLPRMELCGALLLAKLMDKLKITLTKKQLHIHCWTDSQVVLAWLQGNTNRWERYVSNRVKEINKIVPSSQWRYVKSEENSADCASRGLSPSQLLTFNLWWEGPQWLRTKTIEETQEKPLTYVTDNELKTKTNCYVMKTNTGSEVVKSLLDRHSNLNRIVRIIGWILRYTTVSRNKPTAMNAAEMNKYLSAAEMKRAMEIIIKNTQRQHFDKEIEHLQKNGYVHMKSSLLKLAPFLDKNGILRVKGRLEHSTLPPETRHPIILPATGRLTELIIHEAHHQTLHGGARLTLAQIRLKYWIIGGNSTTKKHLRQCVRCHRFKPHRANQIMADLPKERVTPSRPFTNTGVDFTGYVDIKINKGRGVKTCKGYISIFICMVTKAVHLELVSDLSTQTFLAAFQRLCARRGTPKRMYSDNGTNFVGAARVLQKEFEAYKTFSSPEFHNEINQRQIEWSFNAPLWPTAGGLWEAAVKSMKYHLKRVLGEQKLTFEQFTTLLTQVEACMNSRPLCPLTEDPDDLDYLTPGHFLIGGPIISKPHQEEDFNQNDLRNRWKLIEQMNLHIWKRWSNDYLHQMQIRSKWQLPRKNLERGNVVIIKEDNLPPTKWALGKVLELHPGPDGNVRVVTLKTKGGQIKRPITRLSPLPISANIQTTDPHSENDNVLDEQQESPPRRPRRQGARYNCLTLLMMMCLALMGTTYALPTDDYNITPLEGNHPIYFDETGRLQLIHDEWILLVYYNLTSYWQATTDINLYVSYIDKTCHQMSHPPCDSIVGQLRHELKHLADYNSLLLSQHLPRQKRGYVNGIGNLMGTLFGVLDENFAEKYEKDIETLQSNDNYLLQLMKNQTMIIEAENNIVKKNEKYMESQFQSIHSYMYRISSELTKLETRVQTLLLMTDVNSASLTASLIISNLQRIQEMLLNTLSNIYKGHLDMHLLPASQLAGQLNTISGRLPKGLSVPIKNIQQDIQDIYQLLYVRARITNNYLLFELHIPLISDEAYTIYRVLPIPFIRKGHLKIIQPSSSYIAINFVKNAYITLGDRDLQQCATINDENLICLSHQPVYNLHDTNAPCEAKVFSQQTSPLSCVINDVQCHDSWIKLHQANVWLLTCCNQRILRVICEDQVTSVISNGTGIMTLRPKCMLQLKDATIFSYNHLGSRMDLEADVNVPVRSSAINKLFNLNWHNALLNLTQMKPAIDGDFQEIQKQLTYQRQHEALPYNLSTHDISHYAMSSLLCGGILIVIIYLLLKKLRRSKKTQTEAVLTDNTQQQTMNEQNDIELQEIYSTPQRLVQNKKEEKPSRGFSFD